MGNIAIVANVAMGYTFIELNVYFRTVYIYDGMMVH